MKKPLTRNCCKSFAGVILATFLMGWMVADWFQAAVVTVGFFGTFFTFAILASGIWYAWQDATEKPNPSSEPVLRESDR